jgi:large subunit ribosomal protein L22
MRIVVNLVRGKRVPEALNILHFMPHKATRPVELAIQNAVHNLMDQNRDERFDEQALIVREIRVDEGPMFKRYRPAPRGRAHPIRKRTSHLTVVVGTVERQQETA